MNKIWLGSAVTALLFCGIIAANSLLFPSVLAISGEGNEVQSVNVEELTALVESSNEMESGIDNVNLISEEKAVELALMAFKASDLDVDVSEMQYETRLVEKEAPAKTANWYIVFYNYDDRNSTAYSTTINAFTGTAEPCLKLINMADLVKEGKLLFSIGCLGDENKKSDPLIVKKEDSYAAGVNEIGIFCGYLFGGDYSYTFTSDDFIKIENPTDITFNLADKKSENSFFGFISPAVLEYIDFEAYNKGAE